VIIADHGDVLAGRLFRVGGRLPSTTELLVFRNDGELDLE